MRTLAAIFTCAFLLSLSAGPASSAGVVSQPDPVTGEVSFWPESATPGMLANPDAVPVELGLKFKSDVAGRVTGVRFYKSTTNTGTHVGHLWSSGGQLLACATFTGESASGWQTVRFASPISIQANTLYVVSYHTDVGQYSGGNGFFGTARDVPPLHAPAGTNGVYHYGATAFPTHNYRSSNYWVDVLFLAEEAPSGGGLTGQYYDNSDFTNLKLTRTDATVNFSWGAGSPSAALGADTFSVVWTGRVTPRYSETYTFTTVTDDGVRLWVNGQQLVNDWNLHSPKANSGTVALVADQAYDIKMEYFENLGGATAQLKWKSASQALEIIPESRLTPATAPPQPPTDTTPPTVAVTAPASGATVSNTLSVTGTAADNVAVCKVELQVDSGAFQTASGTTRWTHSLNTTGLTNGSHSLTARATDSSGNTKTASISVTVSNTRTGNHCASNPHLCGFPDSTNTGLQPPGVTLTSYTGPLTITAAGTVIDGKLINGVINIDADNVTMRRSKVVYPHVNCDGTCEVVSVKNGHTGFLIEDSEVDGNGGLCYISIQLGVRGTALRNNLHGCGDGVRSGDGALVKDNWMHDFGKGVFDGDPYADSPHNDGYQGISTSHVRVEHNTIILPPYSTPNSGAGVDGAVLFGDEFGPITDIHFNNNLVDTTSYSIRFGHSCTPSTCEAIGNRIGRSYQMYGAFYPGVSFTKSGNVWDDTGEPVN